MDDKELQPGDVVQLKSGGPEMTVKSINSDKFVICVYYDEAKNEIKDNIKLPAVVLKKQAPPSFDGLSI